MRILMVLPAVLMLAGCGPSRDEMISRAANECQDYGAGVGSPAYVQCMMMKDQQMASNEMQRRAIAAQALSNMSQSIQAPTMQAPVTMAPRTCNSSVIGNQVQTNCY